jgi:phosphatidylinositol alpha 1,6-mannosyltransferase
MASGLPTVCADASGSNSLVDNSVTGYLQDTKKISGFVEHITELVQNSVLRKAMGVAARKRALTFNWDSILEKLVASFVVIANEKSAGP